MNNIFGKIGLSQELLHPLLVHFPMALWFVASLLFVLAVVKRFPLVEGTSIFLGLLGSVGGWLALKSGELAYNVVESSAPYPILKAHQESAETAMIFFSSCFGILALSYVTRNRFFKGRENPSWLKVALLIGLSLGNIYLYLTSSKGMTLVYRHGVAVQMEPYRDPTPKSQAR